MAWQAPKERRPLRLGHVIWGLVCLFLMGWGFVLGMWVGQGSLATPEQVASLRQWVSFLPGLSQPVPQVPEEQAEKQDQAAAQPQLSFYSTLEKGEVPPPAAPTTTATKPPEAPKTPEAAKAAEAGKPVELAQAGQAQPPPPKPAENRPLVAGERRPFTPDGQAPPVLLKPGAPVPPGKTPPPAPAKPGAQALAPNKPGAPPAPPGKAAGPQRQGRFTVQVASFKEEGQARDLMAQLKSGGHPAYMVPVKLDGVGTRFRVRVGPFFDRDLAQGAAGRIRLQLTLAAYVTQEE